MYRLFSFSAAVRQQRLLNRKERIIPYWKATLVRGAGPVAIRVVLAWQSALFSYLRFFANYAVRICKRKNMILTDLHLKAFML